MFVRANFIRFLTVIRDSAVSSVIRVRISGISIGEDLVVIGETILVQINGALGEVVFESTRLTLLATVPDSSGIVVRITGIGSGKRSDAISQRCDDFLGDFLLLEEGGGSRGLLSSIGLENDALDFGFNGSGCAVDYGMSVVCIRVDSSIRERDLGSGTSQEKNKDLRKINDLSLE